MEENKKEKFVNSKLFFWIRFGLYALFMFIIPAAFLFVKFKLFQKITAFQIGGWGVVFILIVGFGMIKLVKEVKKGLPFCYATQVLNGTLKVLLPLTLCTLILYVMQDNVKDVLIMMYVLIPCELVAILVNPLPFLLVLPYPTMLPSSFKNTEKSFPTPASFIPFKFILVATSISPEIPSLLFLLFPY